MAKQGRFLITWSSIVQSGDGVTFAQGDLVHTMSNPPLKEEINEVRNAVTSVRKFPTPVTITGFFLLGDLA